MDARSRFDDFADRVVDARPDTTPDARQVEEVPDITGQYLLTIDPVPIRKGAFIRYIADATMTRTGSDIAVSVDIRALNYQTLELVTADPQGTWKDVTVNSGTGEFDLELVNTQIPGPANAAVPGLGVTVTGTFSATVQTADLWCGTVTGATNLGTRLDGSTFAAIRIEPGTLGMDLPDPLAVCPTPGADAGVPDAAPVDASPADAGPADAGPADAAPADAST